MQLSLYLLLKQPILICWVSQQEYVRSVVV